MIKATVSLFVLLSLSALAVHTILSWVPCDLGDVDEGSGEVVDLKERLSKALNERYKVEISEAELNQYLNHKLTLKQSSIVDDYVKIQGVYVDLQTDKMEVSIKRVIDFEKNLKEDGSKQVPFLPATQTVSLQLQVTTRTNEQGEVFTAVEVPGGSFGRSPAPGGLVFVVKPSFDVLADFFKEELGLAYNNKTSVTLKDGVLVVDASELTER